MVAGRERELQERRIRDLAGRAPSEETALEQVLLASPSGRRDLRRGPDGTLVLEQPLQHADRGVERRARALRRFAVPTAVVELLADETAREALRRASEVGAERERAPVDARLHLALEERLRCRTPRPTGSPPRDAPPPSRRQVRRGRRRSRAGAATCRGSATSRGRRPGATSRPIPGGREFRRRLLRAGRGRAPRRPPPGRRPLDRASPASGWPGPNRAASRWCPWSSAATRTISPIILATG